MRTLLALVLLSTTACVDDSTGSTDPGMPDPDPMMPVTLTISGPGVFNQLDGNGTPTCETQLMLTGQFVSAGSVDTTAGCQPDGTWTVQVVVGPNGETSTLPACSGTPSIPSTFTYTVAGAGHSTTITYSGKMGGEEDDFAINGDGGVCTGSFSHVMGSTQIVLHPRTADFGSGHPNG